jgi:hypothetical protein
MSDSGTLLLLLLARLALTGLPGVAAALFAARCGLRQVPLLLGIALAGSGAVAMLAFWAYYADPGVGQSFAWFALLGSLLLTAWSLRGGGVGGEVLRGLATPLALWALGSAFVLFLGFAHGGGDAPLTMAAGRFSGQLPTDNDIPRFFSEWFYLHGHNGTPPLYPGNWLASDRPPLQIGYVLTQRTFGWDGSGGLDYEVLGVVLQQLWIVGLWALLLAARLGRVTRGLVLVAVLVSDVAIVNGFYVWPKLLPAAFLLAAAALIVTSLWDGLRRDLGAAALLAALLALAMLGHGSSLFAILPLAAVAALRGLPSGRWIGVALAVGAVLMAPWLAYQHYGDPPANRLDKWMLAGVPEIDSRSTGEAIVDSYREAGLGGAVHDKAENFVTMAGGGPAWSLVEQAAREAGDGHLGGAVVTIREMLFFYLLPSLGLLLLGPLAMAVRGRRRARDPGEWRFALLCLGTVALGCLLWGLILFGNLPARTVIHVGSLALPILAICGCVAGLRAVLPRFAVYYVAFASALSLAIYVPAFIPVPGSAWSPSALVLTAAALAGFALVALRAAGPGEAATRLARR